jgi:hypothetical protein
MASYEKKIMITRLFFMSRPGTAFHLKIAPIDFRGMTVEKSRIIFLIYTLIKRFQM